MLKMDGANFAATSALVATISWMFFAGWLLCFRWQLLTAGDIGLLMLMAVIPAILAAALIVAIARTSRELTSVSRAFLIAVAIVGGALVWYIVLALVIKAAILIANWVGIPEFANNSIQFLWAKNGYIVWISISMLVSVLFLQRKKSS